MFLKFKTSFKVLIAITAICALGISGVNSQQVKAINIKRSERIAGLQSTAALLKHAIQKAAARVDEVKKNLRMKSSSGTCRIYSEDIREEASEIDILEKQILNQQRELSKIEAKLATLGRRSDSDSDSEEDQA